MKNSTTEIRDALLALRSQEEQLRELVIKSLNVLYNAAYGFDQRAQNNNIEALELKEITRDDLSKGFSFKWDRMTIKVIPILEIARRFKEKNAPLCGRILFLADRQVLGSLFINIDGSVTGDVAGKLVSVTSFEHLQESFREILLAIIAVRPVHKPDGEIDPDKLSLPESKITIGFRAEKDSTEE